MFGPNTYVKTKVNIKYSHRDDKFLQLYQKVSEKFKKKFNLNDYEIIFIPGSGTVGMESIIFSLRGNINVTGYDGEFKER
jgi:aspartate aminotransferase-like enzyme